MTLHGKYHLAIEPAAKEVYDSKVKFRKIIRALVKSHQCDPKDSDRDDMIALNYSYGCAFVYKSHWYLMVYNQDDDQEFDFHIMSEEDEFYIEWVKSWDYSTSLAKKRRYPQFKQGAPVEWTRFMVSVSKVVEITDFIEIVELGIRVKELERKYGEDSVLSLCEDGGICHAEPANEG